MSQGCYAKKNLDLARTDKKITYLVASNLLPTL